MECKQCDSIGKGRSATRIILITGFLGSGKTSLLQHLLSDNSGQEAGRTGVIVNEFGRVSIDGAVLGSLTPQIIELNNGSIFCQCLAHTFIDSIAAMLELDLDELYIESTGLADPSNMQDILNGLKKKTSLPFVNAGIICLVDAKNFRKLSQSSEMINRQILQSSIVIINKSDLVSPQDLESVRDAIRRLNPLAKILVTTHGQIQRTDLARLHRSRLGHSLNTLNTPAGRKKTFTFTLSDPVSRDNLFAWLNTLQSDVFRIKGFIRIEGETGYWLVSQTGGDVSITKADMDNIVESIVVIPYLETLNEQNLRNLTETILQTGIVWHSE